ncbi:8826_t:CDS:2 [Cetraspora pellucida]|uniref:8826_t:CDS:1 n=1 Tax=Cetraspora pellucida TaxID=1433469 RepID=A0A9N8YUS4_9GLOM|nr:8826_t:CDS:2 [Cetraspora pellucida]
MDPVEFIEEIIKTPESDNDNTKSYIILIRVKYSYKPEALIYKFDNHYMSFDKNFQKINAIINDKLKEYFEPKKENIKNLYNKNKMNLIGYFLDDIEFYTLEKKTELKNIELKEISLDEFITEFGLRESTRTKISNLIVEKNKKHYETVVLNETKGYKHELVALENIITKALKRINSENPNMVIRVKQEIKIEERQDPFVFGFVGAQNVGKTNVLIKFKMYLLNNGIKEEEIYVTKSFSEIISSMNTKVSKTHNNIQKELIKYYGKTYQEIENIQEEKKIKFILFDNTPYDILIYSQELVDENNQRKKFYYRYNNINESDYNNSKFYTLNNSLINNEIIGSLINKFIVVNNIKSDENE